MRFKIHRAELPLPHRIFDPSKEPLMLYFLTEFEPVLHQNNAIVFEEGFESRTHAEKVIVLFSSAEFHYMFDERTVIPTAIEKHYLARCWQFLDIALCK